MKNTLNYILIFLLGLIILSSCNNSTKETNKSANRTELKKEKVIIPEFNEDSAYVYIEKQVAFGPRVPETEAHAQCAAYLENTLKRFAPKVEVQHFKARLYDGRIKNGKNIIASFQPEKKNRILFCAHWDTRAMADMEEDEEAHTIAIDGANDGGSGVGVLIELARQISLKPVSPGIDIVFFDLEDWGEYSNDDSWCLGSQHWSKNPHVPNYRARYGILLDMVGNASPQFSQEYMSLYYASAVVEKVWSTAERAGYSKYFLNQKMGALTDDHIPINENLNIPTIDIIHYDEASETGFFEHWHTRNDNMDQIDPQTLKIVGQTLTNLIYEER